MLLARSPGDDGRAGPRRSDGLEIERKFLVAEPSSLDGCPREEIEQGYLAVDGEVELCVRRRADRAHALTAKAGRGEARVELEGGITPDRFQSLWPYTAGRRLCKARHRVPGDQGLLYEVDRYAGWLSGLVTAEVELPSAEAAGSFQPPAWFGREVTDDPEHRNQSLAKREARARAERVFRLRAAETVPDGIRQIALGRIDEVVDRLSGRTDEELPVAVHEARKSLKRPRTVVRLDAEPVVGVGAADAVRGLTGRRRAELQAEAFRGGLLVYADAPDAFVRRIGKDRHRRVEDS